MLPRNRAGGLRDTIRALDVTCVFDEPRLDQRLISTITEGMPVRSGTLDPLGTDVEEGPDLYFAVLRNLAASFTSCLAPAEQEWPPAIPTPGEDGRARADGRGVFRCNPLLRTAGALHPCRYPELSPGYAFDLTLTTCGPCTGVNG